MGKVAFVCPGQGAQYVGMGRAMAEQYSEAAEVFERADEALGISIKLLCFEGPEAELRLTHNTQPAILATTLAVYAVVSKLKIVPDFVAGHSLGEYSALVMAGSLSFDTAVKLVRARGEFMEEAVPSGEGTMAAILGLERALLANVCAATSREVGPVELANVNCPGQIVISGLTQAVEKACVEAKAAGAKRAIGLDVSGPFHSSLMAPVKRKLSELLQAASVKNALIEVVANVTGAGVSNAIEIKTLLAEQVVRTVLWEDCVRHMIAAGVTTFVEIGPGKVLSGLIKKIDSSVKVLAVEDPASFERLKEAMSA